MTTNDTMAKLPLCEPVFIPKVKRSVCQAKQWVNAGDPSANLGSVFNHAEKTDIGLTPIMYTGLTATELIDDLFCECTNGAAYEQCPCFLNGLPCIDICNCGKDVKSCKNDRTLFATVNTDTDQY